jgi:serine/threonine-protein kinase HipA
LSPTYDMLNTRMYVDDADFALEDGLLPRNLGQGTIWAQLGLLAEKAGLGRKLIEAVWSEMLSDQPAVEALLHASFLEERHKRSYLRPILPGLES